MKSSGTEAQFRKERARDLLRAYFELIERSSRVVMSEVFHEVVEMPAQRFWVSQERAYIVMCAIERGRSLHGMRPNKREMFEEIYERVCVLRKQGRKLHLSQLVAEAIEQPAPRFYLSPGSARVIILKERKRWHREKLKRLQVLS